MKEHIKRIKEQAKDEAIKGALVIVGAITGIATANAFRKFTEDHPTLNTVVTYGYPVLLAGGGFLITSATDKNSKAKYFGYGLEAAGVIEGVKLIPVAGDYLKGILGDPEIPAANSYLSEDDTREQIMAGFGLSALPVGSASLSDAPSYSTKLPDLEGEDNELSEDPNEVSGLGYNGAATNDEISGLGYNGSATDDADVRGIL
ncbi:MAG: hypothetical protein ACXVPQ_12190 [Bacteroidia bacterium]